MVEDGAFPLAVMAVGRGQLRFQWQRDGVNVSGATNNVLNFTNVQPAEAGNFRVIVANDLGAVTSRVARLQVLVRPRLDPLPAEVFAPVGGTLTLSANATGTPPLRYQWRNNGVNIPGATNATYTLSNAQITDGGSYTVVVANDVGTITSAPILVIVEVSQQPPGDNYADRVLVTGPTNSIGSTNRWATREAGEPFHAGKFGSNSVWYRWVAPIDGIATFKTVGSTFDTLLGVYTNDLSLGARSIQTLRGVASDEDRGGFLTSQLRFNARQDEEYAIAIDGFVGQQGSFILTWEVEPSAQLIPVIVTAPRSQTVRCGANAVFRVAATNGSGLTYQWYLNGVRVTGNASANSDTLTINGVIPANVGGYTVAITNSLGRGIVSLPAALEIGPLPGLQGQDKLEDLFSGLRPPGGGGGGGGFLPASFVTAFFSIAMGTVDYQISSTTEATTQYWEPNHCGVIGGASKWFEFQPVQDGTVVIDTQGSTFDTVLAVYHKVEHIARNLASAVIDCNTDARQGVNWSRVSFEAQAGSNYWVVVDGARNTDLTGRAQLNWAMGRLPRSVSQPVVETLRVGQRQRFWAGVTNAIPAPRYQWLRNGQALAGETNEWLELPSLTLTDAGYYSVTVSNALGAVEQAIATLSAPLFTAQLDAEQGVYRLWLPPVLFPGQNVVVEAKADLNEPTWTPVLTHTNATAPVSVSFPLNTSPQRYFRARPGL